MNYYIIAMCDEQLVEIIEIHEHCSIRLSGYCVHWCKSLRRDGYTKERHLNSCDIMILLKKQPGTPLYEKYIEHFKPYDGRHIP